MTTMSRMSNYLATTAIEKAAVGLMTPSEQAARRYMRAPDGHGNGGGDGGDGGEGGGGEGGGGGNEPEPGGSEINDPVEDTGTPAGQTPAGTVEDEPDGDDGSDTGQGAKPKSTEDRLAELESSLAAERRDREYWQGRADGTINEDGTPVRQPPAEDGSIPADDPDRPDPSKYQYGETDAKYIADLARYEAKLAFQEEANKAEVKRQIDTVENTHNERVTAAKEHIPDYDEVVVKGADPDPVTGKPKWAASPLMSLGIKTSDYGPDIAYHLATNPEESFRIAQLHPIEQAKEFGRLEYRMEQEAKAKGRGGSSDKPVRTSNAPNPPPRARGGGGGRGEVAADTDDFRAFEQRADSHFKSASTKRR